MEALSKSLQPYKDQVGLVAGIVTIGQFLSGGVICKDIYNKKSTRGISITPFVGGIAIGFLNLKYGMLLGDPAMFQVNVAAIVLNLIYTAFFYQYAPNKWEDVLKPLSISVAVAGVFLSYAELENPEVVEYRYGLLITILMLLLLGAPLLDVKTIIEKKDASSIPFPITFMGSIVTFLWLLYAIILLNNFMIVQNLIGFILCIVQLVLIALYPGDPSGVPKKKKKSSKKDK